MSLSREPLSEGHSTRQTALTLSFSPSHQHTENPSNNLTPKSLLSFPHPPATNSISSVFSNHQPPPYLHVAIDYYPIPSYYHVNHSPSPCSSSLCLRQRNQPSCTVRPIANPPNRKAVRVLQFAADHLIYASHDQPPPVGKESKNGGVVSILNAAVSFSASCVFRFAGLAPCPPPTSCSSPLFSLSTLPLLPLNRRKAHRARFRVDFVVVFAAAAANLAIPSRRRRTDKGVGYFPKALTQPPSQTEKQ